MYPPPSGSRRLSTHSPTRARQSSGGHRCTSVTTTARRTNRARHPPPPAPSARPEHPCVDRGRAGLTNGKPMTKALTRCNPEPTSHAPVHPLAWSSSLLAARVLTSLAFMPQCSSSIPRVSSSPEMPLPSPASHIHHAPSGLVQLAAGHAAARVPPRQLLRQRVHVERQHGAVRHLGRRVTTKCWTVSDVRYLWLSESVAVHRGPYTPRRAPCA